MPSTPDTPTPVVIVGCGAITRFFYASALIHLQSRGLAQVTALCDPSVENLNLVGADFPAAARMSKLEDAPVAKGTLVIIASPPALHARQSTYALEKGAAVLCEKPMAGTEADALSMIEAAQATQGILAIGLYRRFFPATLALRDIIRTRRFGKLLSYEVEEGGPFNWEAKSDSFFKRQATPGGVLYDTGVHTLDLLLWWLGEPESLTYQDDAAGGLEANCRAEFRHAEGFTGTVHLSRETPTANLYRFDFEQAVITWKVNAAGELSILLKGMDHCLVSSLIPAKEEGLGIAQNTAPWHSPQGFIQQLINLIETIKGTQQVHIPAQEGLRSLRLIKRCYENRSPLPQPWLSSEENAQYIKLASPSHK